GGGGGERVVWTGEGLGPGRASLAGGARVPVRLAAPSQRLPALVETAVYFICSEALANVAKHARAAHVDIRVQSRGDLVTVLIADDGAGGANPLAGSGLKGVADRVEALGGQLAVDSPAGARATLLGHNPRGG